VPVKIRCVCFILGLNVGVDDMNDVTGASTSTSKKHDKGKPRWDLLPLGLIEEVVKVLTFGSMKYNDNNWQGLDNANERYYAAAMRHLVAWRNGEMKDSESGLSHLAHAACCLVFLFWFETKS
jgi:hypothetical protein